MFPDRERSRAGSDAAQEEERARVEIVEQMLSLRVPMSHEPGLFYIYFDLYLKFTL